MHEYGLGGGFTPPGAVAWCHLASRVGGLRALRQFVPRFLAPVARCGRRRALARAPDTEVNSQGPLLLSLEVASQKVIHCQADVPLLLLQDARETLERLPGGNLGHSFQQAPLDAVGASHRLKRVLRELGAQSLRRAEYFTGVRNDPIRAYESRAHNAP